MNMKKTFAGAMAGALAVSAMATSASASIPGPGEYTIDLTKDAEFYATVQFTFDADYMISAKINNMVDGSKDKYLGINFADFSGDFDISGMKELTVDVVGSTGVKTQTLKYNTTWNDVNFYNWNLFNYGQAYSVNGKVVGNSFMLPVANNGVHADAQTLYLDKYNTVKEALAVKMADGNKKYPLIFDDAGDAYVDDVNNELDYAYFDKIVVTAKIPAKKKFTLDALNGVGGYKTKVTASIDGVHDLEIFELDNDTTEADELVEEAMELVEAAQEVLDLAKADLAALKAANTAFATYSALTATTNEAAQKANVEAAKATLDAEAAALQTTIRALGGNYANYTVTPATLDELTQIGAKYYIGTGAAAQEVTAGDVTDYKAALNDYNTKLAAYNKVLDAKAGFADYDYTTQAEFDAAILEAEDAVKDAEAKLEDAKDVLALALAAAEAAVGTFVGVDVDDAEPVTRTLSDYSKITLPEINGETLFTKFESNKVGVKTGIVIDDNKVKTLSGDIGAWKPDALRQIADAIADNEGVTLTFTAKDAFDDAAYRAWFKEVQKYGVNGVGTHVLYGTKEYGTDNVKDSYEVWGVSMFTGAIVLNRDFSKQFAESNLVDWGTNTLTFDWDTLTEGRFYDASIVLHSMELLSTQNCEWVSCTVTVPEQGADAEEVDPSQGAEDNSTEIDDTPVTEATEVITEAPATEAPAVTEAAPVAPVTNPTTGNAPVALAVIPVALAAAAIVAKKRG